MRFLRFAHLHTHMRGHTAPSHLSDTHLDKMLNPDTSPEDSQPRVDGVYVRVRNAVYIYAFDHNSSVIASM